ncbi:hypothetical protein BKK51_10165 [Rodentibacter trehalosifermentans]|uniref:Uncharacterized protein n=1 Tax=Rodentibacter trehalosifermentans TaxID=1908263 RepID=A0A1V3IPH6_9PAST|nr:hypothetical protein [Rodentibacter trehalosifermentans]OOF44021.1 hypothetical protein BKK51_10165 [Rodentibacter trehalosifermentans]
MLINNEQAFDAFYALLQAKPWLTKVEKQSSLDPMSEKIAITFLYTLEDQDETTWQQLSDKEKNVVNGLIVDTMFRLRIAQSRTWEISYNSSLAEQAIEIIKQEIRRSHHQLLTVQ